MFARRHFFPSDLLPLQSPDGTCTGNGNGSCCNTQLFIDWNKTSVAKTCHIVKEKRWIVIIYDESIRNLLVAKDFQSSIGDVLAFLPHLLSQYINLTANQVLLLISKLGPSFKWPHKLSSDMFELNPKHNHNFTKGLFTKILYFSNARIKSLIWLFSWLLSLVDLIVWCQQGLFVGRLIS